MEPSRQARRAAEREQNYEAERAARKQREPAQEPLAEVWTSFVEQAHGRLDWDNPNQAARQYGPPEPCMRQVAGAVAAGARLFINAIYEVTSLPTRQPAGWTHLMIRRRDGKPDVPWSHKQRIKSELVGPECEAVELFPAESRLFDLAHVYHLWTNADPRDRLKVGFDDGRNVAGEGLP
jgi:hypothetical protein